MLSSEVLSFSSISTSSSRDYTQLPMESLLKLKRTYINRFEYEKAKKVQAVINERKIEDINGIIQECKEKIDQKIDEIENELQRKREIVNIQYKFKELDISEKMDNAFQILQERHLEELASIEKQKALGYVRAIHKPIKESRELLAQSKRLAENDDFDGAVKIREKSRKVKEEVIQVRKDQVNQKYELMRKQLYSKQKNDLQILSEKLHSALNKNELEKLESLKAQDKLAKNTIVFHQQRILGEMIQKVRSKDNKLEMSDQINKFLSQRIAKFNERVEQSNIDALKSQSQTAQTSVIDFSISVEGNVTNSVEEEGNINYEENENYDIKSEDFIKSNDGIESNDIDNFQDTNEAENGNDDFQNIIEDNENLEDNGNELDENLEENDVNDILGDNENELSENEINDNLEDNEFDAIDDNLQLNGPDQQNYEEEPANVDNIEEEEEVFIKDSEQQDDFQNNDEEEQINSYPNQEEDGNENTNNDDNNNLNVEDELDQNVVQDENLNENPNLDNDGDQQNDQDASNHSMEFNDDLVPGSPNFSKSDQPEQESPAMVNDTPEEDNSPKQNEL